MPTRDPGPPVVIRVRAAIFVAAALWIVGTPALVQVLHLRVKWVRPWRMYAGVGIGVCDVTYTTGDVPIDYVAAFYDGAAFWQIEPYRRRVHRDNLRSVGADLCRVLDVSEVRGVATCATNRSWKPTMDGSVNLCAPPPRRRRAPR